MARNYILGLGGFGIDYDKGFEFATKAANAGDKNGQLILGYCYHHGHGVRVDYAAALTWCFLKKMSSAIWYQVFHSKIHQIAHLLSCLKYHYSSFFLFDFIIIFRGAIMPDFFQIVVFHQVQVASLL